jgi:two-component system chemotaxis response regulator CheY
VTGNLRKFLIVDDHAGFRRTIRAFLPEGIVTECDDGSKVLACYAAEQPDWVFLDIAMPTMDGFTAARQLKEHFPGAHVIIISNHGEEEFRREARALGLDGFIHKAHLEQLAQILSTPV